MKKLKYVFTAGDEVITRLGERGIIKEVYPREIPSRSYEEFLIQYDSGSTEFMSRSQHKQNFGSFYKIGNYIFGNVGTEVELGTNNIDEFAKLVAKNSFRTKVERLEMIVLIFPLKVYSILCSPNDSLPNHPYYIDEQEYRSFGDFLDSYSSRGAFISVDKAKAIKEIKRLYEEEGLTYEE